ncbi:MAG: [FeFe] hydrogenase H-cluster maturation GTPase HydF [Pseudomonadota bacterium]|jgi:2-iminoacetate synthase
MLDTPKGLRLHIGIFGRRNVGKSSLMNALTGQAVSIVSDVPGTTTDPVEKTLELAPLGPIVFVDTAGIDDEGVLGEQRTQRTLEALARVDVAIVVTDSAGIGNFEAALIALLKEKSTPFFVALNKSDLGVPSAEALQSLTQQGIEHVAVSALQGTSLDRLKEALFRHAPEGQLEEPRLVGDLLSPGDVALLVVPIDLGAPKGRLILPQVQALRDILDSDATGMIVKERELRDALARLTTPPRLVICDSQVVLKVTGDTPPEIPLTTFSILMARFKGDFMRLAEGAGAITRLKPGDRVLVAESCSHHPQADDIGRVKIPRWLRQYVGGNLEIDVMAGRDFPDDLSPYALIVQCGGCTITRKQMLVRQYRAAGQGVPMTNYGMTISVVQGVLDRSLAPFPAAHAAYRRAAQTEPGGR